jgi:hypothetical protein
MQLFDQSSGNARVDHGFPGMGVSYRLGQVVGVDILEHIRERPGTMAGKLCSSS